MFISNNEITIKVKTLNSTTFPININKRAKISELKAAIFQKVRIHSNNQKLIFQGKVLDNTKSLTDYKIEQYDVIHLVETDSRQYQEPPSSNTNSNSNGSSLGEYERLINSIFPSFDDILNSLRSNNNNNNTNNNNINNNNNNTNNNNINNINNININNNGNSINDLTGNNDNEGIFDSFKHLLKYKSYNYVRAGEVITQNFDNLYNMYNNLIDLNLDNSKNIKKLYSLNYNTNFKVGQWIDFKDRFDNWIEGQITSIRDNKVKVQYLGMPPNMNEWLNKTSDRIAVFRSYTLQKNLKNFFSLYPNKSQEYNREQIHVQENIPISYTGIKKFEPLNNHLVLFMDLFKEKIKNIMKIKEKVDRGTTYFMSKDEFLDSERLYFLSCMQVFPLLDRFGRIMIDLANFLMYNSYNYFEDNIFNFRKNVYDESLRFMNIHDRRETVNKNRLKHFQTLVQFSCAKTEKDDNIENLLNNNENGNHNNENNNNSNNNNSRRPLYGIFISRPREPTRQDYINRSRRYMVAREHIDIISNKTTNNLTKYTQTDPIKKKFDKIKQEKKVINIFIKSSYDKKIIKTTENKENNNKVNNLNEIKLNLNNNPISKNNNININNNIINNNNVNNNNVINNKGNILLRSTANNHNNIIRKEKIQIEAKKKEDEKREVSNNNNNNNNNSNNNNLNNIKLHRSVDKKMHSNYTRVKKGGYKVTKSKGKFSKK